MFAFCWSWQKLFQFIFDLPVCHCETIVLSLMLGPGIDGEALQVTIGNFGTSVGKAVFIGLAQWCPFFGNSNGKFTSARGLEVQTSVIAPGWFAQLSPCGPRSKDA